MATTKHTTTADILRAYGFDADGEDGALVRARGERPIEQFRPVEGGWEFSTWQDGAWRRRKHHVDAAEEDGVRTMTPVYTWPDDEVAHVYAVALDERAARG